MHVIISAVTGNVVSTKLTKYGYKIRKDDPKEGYWRIVWKRKRGGIKDVTGVLTKKEAQTLADMLNTLSGRQVSLLIKSLHTGGAAAQREYQRKNQHYTGRSFARN